MIWWSASAAISLWLALELRSWRWAGFGVVCFIVSVLAAK